MATTTSNTTYLDREKASEILKVSTRTVDRYIRKYKLKTKKKGRVLLIRKQDVDKIIQEHVGHLVDLNPPEFSHPLQDSAAQDQESALTVKNIKIDQVRTPKAVNEEEKVYKDLYSETKKELQAKQERLEAATYRVGQLETQLKNMVPLLDYTQKEKQLKQSQEALEQKAVENKQVIEKMEKEVKTERMAKWIYLSLVGLLLVVEPILFLMWAL